MAIILDKIKSLFRKNKENIRKEDKQEDMDDSYALPDAYVVESYGGNEEKSGKKYKHANYVNEVIEKFYNAKSSGASKDMIENLGEQVIVAMQKESIDKAREIKENNSDDYVGILKEFNEKQQGLINRFKSDNGLGEEKQSDLNNSESYLQKIILSDKEKSQRNI
ncbi:MAG: hypothetical protein PQ612_02075 [Rickettsiales bacterium]|nr:hypothetical protein [Pseudomonadota bacterium]MDA0967086.1 hypothetical protein [Pseudomonadota bacterium]MDG4542428.1 hypothetical protein [Rickettsiales bacterium]MDG4544932.1 hypothetical protein [Rickettsiales bacterium]MDG4547055.1 hypothetical protein [Rickettsiales bacterium]